MLAFVIVETNSALEPTTLCYGLMPKYLKKNRETICTKRLHSYFWLNRSETYRKLKKLFIVIVSHNLNWGPFTISPKHTRSEG